MWPTRSAVRRELVILTGKYGHKNGITWNRKGTLTVLSKHSSLKIMRANGYQTALIGKWHLKSDQPGLITGKHARPRTLL